MERNLKKLGSQTARSGFKNERDIVKRFNNWKSDKDAQSWLIAMGYKIEKIESVVAVKIVGSHKADIQVKVTIVFKSLLGIENISIKLVTSSTGFNQIDKREVDKYVALWNIPEDIESSLKLFTGRCKPTRANLRDKRRVFLNEMTSQEQKRIVSFFKKNKILILSDLIKGSGKFSADWLMVIWKQRVKNPKWIIVDINFALNFFGDGPVEITKRGSLRIGKVGMQRKGGDGGRPSSEQLQFKTNPLLLFKKEA